MTGDSAVITPSRSPHGELNIGQRTTDHGRRLASFGEFSLAIDDQQPACNGKSRPETNVSSFRTPGPERPAIHRHERHQRHGMSQRLTIKRFASTAKSAALRHGCVMAATRLRRDRVSTCRLYRFSGSIRLSDGAVPFFDVG
jgi:hypothetical protein